VCQWSPRTRSRISSARYPHRDAYLERLALVHQVMVAAMKTKQQVSTEAAKNLDEAIAAMAEHE
jgi:hypothetical protein